MLAYWNSWFLSPEEALKRDLSSLQTIRTAMKNNDKDIVRLIENTTLYHMSWDTILDFSELATISLDARIPLSHIAIINNRPDVVRALIKAGASVHGRSNFGWDAIHMAAYCGNVEAARILISNGANLNSSDHKFLKPLHIAVIHKHQDFIKFLMQQINKCYLINFNHQPLFWTVDINQTTGDQNKFTALHFAIKNYDIRMISLLLDLGALDVQDASETVLSAALKTKNEEIIRLLIGLGFSLEHLSLDGTSEEIKALIEQSQALDAQVTDFDQARQLLSNTTLPTLQSRLLAKGFGIKVLTPEDISSQITKLKKEVNYAAKCFSKTLPELDMDNPRNHLSNELEDTVDLSGEISE